MDDRIADRIEAIKKDRVHGAGFLSEQAVSTLIIAATENSLSTVAGLQNEIAETSSALITARPTMVSIANTILTLGEQIRKFSKPEIDAATFKSMVRHLGDSYIHEIERSQEKAAGYGADVLNDGSTVLTCSYSSMVIRALVAARDRGNNVNIFIAESRSSGLFYGKLMAEELKQKGITSIIIPDRDSNQHLHRATIVLTGADCILSNGAVINGAPSLNIAREAASSGRRFYSICETAKFDIYNLRGTDASVEEGLDKVPAELITGLITEKGIISPAEIKYFLAEIDTEKDHL